MKNQKLVGVFTVLGVMLATFQGLLPTIPMNTPTLTLLSAITMYLLTGVTLWKQTLSHQIDNAAKWPTIIVAIVATVGGLNELINLVSVSESLAQWLRFAITFITMFLNLISKVLWPTMETKSTL